MKVGVIGAGAWGTALGLVLARRQHEVVLWGHDPEHLRQMEREARNERYLPGVDLPKEFRYETHLNTAVAEGELVVVAVPSKVLRNLVEQMNGAAQKIVSVTKGIEYETGLTMSGVIRQCAPGAQVAALSGPTFASEVARGIPSAIVAASDHAEFSEEVQGVFHSPAFRVYSSADPLGVELGGAIKNVIAIAAGVGDGLGFGDNSKAALVTRALAEMRRLGVACGAQAETFSGLSGLGDLVATCFSKLSRNRGFGERVGRGEKAADVLAGMTTVAEGYPTARSAWQLAQKKRVDTPIIDEVYAMLYEGKDLKQAVHDLTTRGSKAED